MRTLEDLAAPSHHEIQIKEAFGDHAYFDGVAPVFEHPLYLLGFHNRCGSNLLAEALNTTHHFAGFREQLNSPNVLTMCRQKKLKSFPDYIQARSVTAQRADKAYGFKASWAQIAMLLRFGIDRMYPSVRVLHMTRQDVLAQAISYWIAFQTKQWTSKVTTRATEPVFDAQKIETLLQAILFTEQAIALLCTLREIPRHRIVYEEFLAAPAEEMHRIGQFCDLDLSDWVPTEPALRRQTTSLNADFRDRFRDYLSQKSEFLSVTSPGR